jgi:hypothetical protein
LLQGASGEATIVMAQKLGLQAVAEGVEPLLKYKLLSGAGAAAVT